MDKIYVVIKSNYVIDRIYWNPQTYPDYQYPFEHDLFLEDINQNINIGDWYDSAEGIFYRPLSTPPDWPPVL